MKIRRYKNILALLTVVFAGLGVLNIVDYDYSLPFMFLCLAGSMGMQAKERYDAGARKGIWILCATAGILVLVTVLNLAVRFL